MTNKEGSIKFEDYVCNLCDYSTCRKSQYDRHISTLKHQIRTSTNCCTENSSSKFEIKPSKEYKCMCNKVFKHASSLWNHKQKCNNLHDKGEQNKELDVEVEFDKKMLFKMLLKNHDIMEKIIEILPNLGNNSQVHTNSHNTTNNQFNIQMFLNEHCKNAMNLTDFIDSLPITATTFDNTIENGLTKTITNMITNGLSKLDVLERPIHCTDITRKTLYVKEANVWEKDTDLKKIVMGITNLIVKKRDLICEWKEANRGWDTIESKQIRFTELVCNIMTDVERDEKETGKIIRAISKTVYLDSEEKKKYIC